MDYVGKSQCDKNDGSAFLRVRWDVFSKTQGSSKVGRVVWFRCHAVSIAGEQRTQRYAIEELELLSSCLNTERWEGGGGEIKRWRKPKRSQIHTNSQMFTSFYMLLPKKSVIWQIWEHVKTAIRVESTFFWRQGSCPTIPTPHEGLTILKLHLHRQSKT